MGVPLPRPLEEEGACEGAWWAQCYLLVLISCESPVQSAEPLVPQLSAICVPVAKGWLGSFPPRSEITQLFPNC